MQIGGMQINRVFIKETIRYILFGLSGSGLSYGCYFLFTRPLDFDFLPATMIASLIANTYGFFMNHKFVFVSQKEDFQRKEMGRQYFEYISSRLFSCLLEALVLTYFIDTLGMFDILVKTISGFIVGVLNYFFTKCVVFEDTTERFTDRMKLVENKCSRIGYTVRSKWSTRYL